jgi:hypothetical protein
MNPTEPTSEAAAPTSDPQPRRPIRPQDQDPKLWKADGWTARIIKNEDDEGWAVEMTSDGESEPALVGPWTMGRDKKNPKPLDANAFATLVKTANEILARHAQQRRAQLHRSVTAAGPGGTRLQVELDIIPDEEDPHAILTVRSSTGETLSRARVAANFKLTAESARQWLAAADGQG